MGETEEALDNNNEAESDGKKKKIKVNLVNGILTELLRLLVVVIVVVLVNYFMINRKLDDNLISNIKTLDAEANPEFAIDRTVGKEWALDEILINTSDEFANHFVKTKIIFSYQRDNTLSELTARQNQIHAEIRKIIGVEKYVDLKSIRRQEELTREIKNRVQQMIGITDPINVLLKEFTVY